MKSKVLWCKTLYGHLGGFDFKVVNVKGQKVAMCRTCRAGKGYYESSKRFYRLAVANGSKTKGG